MAFCCGNSNKASTGFRQVIINEHNTKVPPERFKSIPTRLEREKLKIHPKNVTKTSKYTVYNFVFIALWRHFTKYTNTYFLFMSVLWLIPSISPFSVSSVVTPMTFITLVSLLREGLEDYARHKSDVESNNSRCLLIKNGKVMIENWRNVVLGDLVLLLKDERIPADILLLSTDNMEGTAFLETSTLDGEKHLKPRYCPKETLNCIDHDRVDPELVKKAKMVLYQSGLKKSEIKR